ncbi:MAG TPA: cyclic nucleotide-binding domain-containing protein [Longimicrobiales bacterium]|nr:cyclic nucleotide-binding domain-containing protein [Longimicrobiales bacterium]
MARGLGVRPGEGRLVAWLLGHSFLNGVAKVLNATAAYTLFLVAFGAEAIPYVYIGAAVAITSAGYLFIRLDQRLSFGPLAAGVLLVAALTDLAFRALLPEGGRRLTLAFTVWTEAEIILLSLVFWGLAGKLFDIQQGKRLFALIGAGEVAAAMVGGALVGWLVPRIGTENLLVISAAALLGSLGVFAHITHRFSSVQPEMRPSSPREESHGGSMGELLRSPYVLLIFALITGSYFGFYFLETVFYGRAESRFPTEEGLAAFLGLFLAAAGFLTLVSRMLVSGRLLRRFGVGAGLLAQPLSVGLLAVGILVAGTALGAPTAVFWLVTAATLTDRVLRESLSEATRLVLYQPLPSRVRVATQAAVESIVGPVAGGLAGLALLLLTRVLGFGTLHLVGAFVGIVALWAVAAVVLRGEYTRALVQALSGRKLVDLGALVPDAETVKLVEARLGSPFPSEVSYALDLLERMEGERVAEHLAPLLEHSSPLVRSDVAARIERLHLRALVPAAAQRAEREQDPAVQGRLRRVLAALGDGETAEWLEHYRQATDPRVREGVLIGMLHSAVSATAEAASGLLEGLLGHASADERALAVRVLAACERPELAPLLRPALEDPSDAVRRDAVAAAAALGAPELWPSVLANLSVPALRGPTVRALAGAGPSLLPEIARRLEDPHTQEDVRLRLVQLCGRVGGPAAVRLLHEATREGSPAVRDAALAALVAAGVQATGGAARLLEEMLEREVAEAAWVLATYRNLGGKGQPRRPHERADQRERARSAAAAVESTPEDVLVEALENHFERLRSRILHILAQLYPARSVARIRANLDSDSPTHRAYALELLENLVPHERRARLLEALGDGGGESGELERLYPQPVLDLPRTLRHILSRPGAQGGAWLNACALHVARLRGFSELAEFAASRIASPSGLVRETAAWALAELSSERFEEPRRLPYGDPRPAVRRVLRERGEGASAAALPTIERALVLATVPIFEQTPRDVLAELAGLLVGRHAAPDEVLLRKGDAGDSLFLVVSGAVRVEDEGGTLAVLRAPSIFGELALLDPGPRSATVVAVAPCELFELPAGPFQEVVHQRLEVVQDLLRVLCRRLRAVSQAALAAPSDAGVVPAPAVARSAARREPTSTLERVLVLRSAALFAETPEQVLAEIATFLVERRFRPGAPVLRKGELGTSMYLVVEGRARVHDGERTLNEVGERSIFGELALLDPQPRSASVTALTELHLFVLEQGPFYELLGERPEVVRGLFRVLARHIRRTSTQVGAATRPSPAAADEEAVPS